MATAAESSPCKFRSLTTSLSSIASFTLWSDARTFSACADNTFISAAHNSASAVVAASSTVSSAGTVASSSLRSARKARRFRWKA
eukprot:CAMPEP_0202772220 /NCGR_PEP_ID=MMETSP1388-20130828/42234_1 /ASSEMBLY_ACC=CAM_ASM_000864 /TAXON_ID=37098 /ORGANISM="Isochrysis sp, Strain CCMP1244" /LENGTH=84 /DNA_ID=CAMNT_0049441187 /DNA_START=190 /DNA_END=444 /DNA_ORIENTATION=+